MREELHKYCWALSALFSEALTIDDGKNLWLGNPTLLEERLNKKELHKGAIPSEVKERCRNTRIGFNCCSNNGRMAERINPASFA